VTNDIAPSSALTAFTTSHRVRGERKRGAMFSDRITILRFASDETTFGMSSNSPNVRVGDVFTSRGARWIVSKVDDDGPEARVVVVEPHQNPGRSRQGGSA
jgi:hypothetical protein